GGSLIFDAQSILVASTPGRRHGPARRPTRYRLPRSPRSPRGIEPRPSTASRVVLQELHPMNVSRRRGFTLIELLVVIAITPVLTARLRPPVQGAGGAARRAQCVNNLKQIGIAVHNYHSAVGSLPPGQLEGNDWMDYSPHTYLLPYLEQGALYNAINFVDVYVAPFSMNQGAYWRSTGNATAWQTKIAAFICPSDIDRLTNPHGHNNYVACSGSSPDSTAILGPSNGPFISGNSGRGFNQLNSWTAAQVFGFHEITDGLSNTACF